MGQSGQFFTTFYKELSQKTYGYLNWLFLHLLDLDK